MVDAGPPVEAAAQAPKTRHRGIFRDPVVRVMTYVATGLVILFLVTVISALVMGVLAPTGPRTLAEKQIAVSGAAVRSGTADINAWGLYMSSLIEGDQYALAKRVIADGRASIDDSRTAEFTLAEARLYAAQKQYDSAIKSADAAMKQMNDVHESLLAGGGMTANSARLDGLPSNYYAAMLVKAYVYRDMGDWDKAVGQLDLYLEKEPTAADILIDRGMARIETGDTKGAEADLRTALSFLPDNAEAKEGLEKLGVTP